MHTQIASQQFNSDRTRLFTVMPRICCQDEVAADALCPCGKNTVKCPGEDVCLPKDVADVICPCKARLQLELLCEPNSAPMLVVPLRARSHKRLAASWITQPQARSPDFRQPALHRATLAPVARIPSAALIPTTCLDCASIWNFVAAPKKHNRSPALKLVAQRPKR